MNGKVIHLISERLNCKLLKAVKQYLPVLFLWTSVGANGVMGDACKSHLVLASVVSQQGSSQVWGFSIWSRLTPQSQQWWALFVVTWEEAFGPGAALPSAAAQCCGSSFPWSWSHCSAARLLSCSSHIWNTNRSSVIWQKCCPCAEVCFRLEEIRAAESSVRIENIFIWIKVDEYYKWLCSIPFLTEGLQSE